MTQATIGHPGPERPSVAFHIFVNRRRFEAGDGVKEQMTGAEIAALVGVPADNAVVRQEQGNHPLEIGIQEAIAVKPGDHFLVTRKIVEGGTDGRHVYVA